MKLLRFLLILCCCVIISQTENVESREKALLERASAQLERLAPYRRTTLQVTQDATSKTLPQDTKNEPEVTKDEERVAFEIYRVLPDDMKKDIVKKIGENQVIVDLLTDPKYVEMIQDRIKRSGSGYGGYGHGGYDEGGYGGGGSGSGGIISGSSSIISGIASGIIGGIASASSSASKGSSSSSSSSSSKPKPEYGHVYSYDDKTFDVWDFKKAIINTLVQAIKAISGGVIALKGQLIKGGGFLISTKGRIISTTGEAITSLGRHIASSAVVSPPKYHPHPGYSYDPPSIQNVGHDSTYDGPPPSAEEYSGPDVEYHANPHYGSPSDDDDHTGLLIVKPTKPDLNNHDDHHLNVDPRNPHLTQPEDSFNGQQNGSSDKDVTLSGTLNSYQNPNEGNLNLESDHILDHPPPIYGAPNHYSLNNGKGTHTNYGTPISNSQSTDLPNHMTIQQSLEYPSSQIGQFQYLVPGKSGPTSTLDLTKGDTSTNDLSMYSSLSFDLNPELESIKISALKHTGNFELPKLQAHINFHGLPTFSNLANTAQEPLRIPILSPLPLHYLQNQRLVHPTSSLGVHGLHRRRSTLQRRRYINDIPRQPTLPFRSTRLHRV